MNELQVEYSGILNWVPQSGTESKVSMSDTLTVVSLFVANIWTAQQCIEFFELKLGRELTLPESDDLTTIAVYVKQGSGEEGKMARLQRVRNGLEAIERGFGLSDLEIRQLAGI